MSQAATGGAGTALRASVAAMGLLRLGVAGWGLARPTQLGDWVGVRPEQQQDAVPYVYALAGRELVLGLGTLAAWRRGHGCAAWITAMVVADGFDALAYRVLEELGTLDRAGSRRATAAAISGLVPEVVLLVALSRHHERSTALS